MPIPAMELPRSNMSSFAVEAPGEANPLSDDTLVNTLRSASSSDSIQIQTGTKQLQRWEHTRGYYKQLQSVFMDHRLPVEVRYLAIIQLKNGIDKYWRKTATDAVSKEDKNVIRARLLDSGYIEPDDRLALQNVLVAAKVARFEFPHDWPDALTSLIQELRSASELPPLRLSRALLMLLHIVKELSTGRLQRTKQSLQAATPEVVHVLSGLYADTVAFWRYNPEENTGAMGLSLLAIKILRRLMVSGYEHPNRDSDVLTFWGETQHFLSSFMQMAAVTGPARTSLDKNMLQLAKLHHEMAKEHPAAFALLPSSAELAQSYWSLAKGYGQSLGPREVVTGAIANAAIGTNGDTNEKSITEKLALRGLLILRACVKMVHNPAQTFKYRTADDKEEKNRAAELLQQQLLTQPLVQEVMEALVTSFFVFRTSDLREWEEEPEEWEKREEGDGDDWEFSVRSCSEKLFLDLAINYKEVLVQPLLQVFYSVATPQNEDVMFKDSVYTAIGLAAPVLHEHLDFDAFIRNVLVPEVQKQKPGFNILRRRAAILLAQWISIKVTERRLVYQTFQHLLNPDDPLNDHVVRVTAGRQLAKIVDDWETKADDLIPYIDLILSRLMLLIREVELSETKMALLNTISVIVERMEHHIVPFAERIVDMLPALWEASGEEHLMKQAILTILARLVNAMKAESRPLHSIVFPIIKGAVQPGSDTEVYLLEDAMDLWASIIVQTPQPASSDVLQLVQYLFPIYEFGSEHLRKSLEITESYILLAPDYMLSSEVRVPLLSALVSLLRANLKPDANGMVCNIVELIIRLAQSGMGQVTADLVRTNVLSTLMEGLHSSWTSHCSTGPLAKTPLVDGIVETDYFSIVARLILANPISDFISVIEASAPVLNGVKPQLDKTMEWLLEEWFSHFENIGDPSRRKLTCLALTRLLETNQPFILLSLQSLMTVWTDVITELREGAEDSHGDSLVYSAAPPAVEEALEAPEDVRRRQMTYSDDVHTVNLPAFVRGYLGQAVAACGGEESFQRQWLVNVDQDVMKGFMQLRIM